ncbi:MAG: class I SAM-dependent methyltransferase [Calditrichaeota bacterium]|jgi:tRNA (cmo5U34)-methyltransferase|nr:class I SAM-dependent methyltransferase [Calditrichota bacterium]MBT7788849.1 class I SAM-dependent methyltransferase [Calditrichota bacterium]
MNKAYNELDRVASYDRDMEIMHPLRTRMVEIGLQVLPFDRDSQLNALDLGVGTGYFTDKFLQAFPAAHVLAIDSAEKMMSTALGRLGPRAERVTPIVDDILTFQRWNSKGEAYDIIFSSFTLHHLTNIEKSDLFGEVVSCLVSGGWFINADLVVANSPIVEERIQELRVEGILDRNQGRIQSFSDRETTKKTLSTIEAKDGDQPLPLLEDIDILRRAGLTSTEVFWKEYREVVYGGPK